MVKQLLQTVVILAAVLVAAGAILTAVFFLVLNQSFTDPPPRSTETRCEAPTLYTSADFSDVTSGCQCPVNPLCCPVWQRTQTVSLDFTSFGDTKTCTLGGSSPCITCRPQSDATPEPDSAPAR